MADEKTRPNRPAKLSNDNPAEGRRDVPANNSQAKPRKYDVDKLEDTKTSADDPAEGRRDAGQGKRR